MSTIDDREIDRLAWTLERSGIAGHEDEIERVVERAGPEGASPVLVGVLGDRNEPECARIRAFGLVAMQLHVSPLAA